MAPNGLNIGCFKPWRIPKPSNGLAVEVNNPAKPAGSRRVTIGKNGAVSRACGIILRPGQRTPQIDKAPQGLGATVVSNADLH
jgi:hypothetical protein